MLTNLIQLIRSEPWQVVTELLIIWFCVYIVFRFLRGTRGAGVVKGLAILIIVATLIIGVLGQGSDALARLSFLYERFMGLLAILLIVVFQPELRAAMVRIGRAISFRSVKSTLEHVVDEVSDAVVFLSKSQFGALIAIERGSQIGGLIEAGVDLDAVLSARLIESIFWPNSPLHDLGVIVRGDRIVMASVQFPLAEEGHLAQEFGSRHRAAVGLTLESDCIVVIVSEETGAISIAEHGRLQHDIDREAFPAVLAERLRIYGREPEPPAGESTAPAAPEAGADDKQAA
jgi:diadenylate cyclase